MPSTHRPASAQSSSDLACAVPGTGRVAGGPVPFAEFVLPWFNAKAARGIRVALVTLVEVDGSSPRPLGSQMAVAEDGSAIGNITGGCAEAAIVTEALVAIESQSNRRIRYGKGSPYFDIRLPCGSGIEIYINARIDPELIALAAEHLQARQPVTLVQDTKAHRSWLETDGQDRPGAKADYRKQYEPARRIVAIGKGAILGSLCQMGDITGFEIVAISTEPELLAQVAPHCAEQVHLKSPRDFAYAGLDQWSAAVLLFHEHEWEPAILGKILGSPCFYVGALGSRRTHASRVQTLGHMGFAAEDILRIRAPVGLDIGASSPPEIAISILGEIIAARRRAEPVNALA